MAGVAGKSGRRSKRYEALLHETEDLAIDVIHRILRSPKLTDDEKGKYALPLVQNMQRRKIDMGVNPEQFAKLSALFGMIAGENT